MNRKINPNLKHLVKAFKNPEIAGASLEGSSRSGKTWSAIYFLIWLCKEIKTPLTINILKETYNSFKTTLHKDFNDILPMFGLYSPFNDVEEKPSFKILGHKINLIGCDKPSKFLGAGCDILWANEANKIMKEIWDQSEMRCTMFWMMDYNPSDEEHWIYDNINQRPDVAFLRTTFFQNPFIPEMQKKKILSYEPTEQNKANGTADEYMWKVYGLGERAARKGVIFKYWKEFRDLPETRLYRTFAIDWGGNDPTTFTQIDFDRKNRNIYITNIYYNPLILNSDLIKLSKTKNPENHEIICDSARKDKIYELQMEGINAFGIDDKSIIDGIDRMKEWNVYVHENSEDAKKEFRSYCWAKDKKTGKYLNKPEDKNNHVIDAVRYGVTYYMKNYGI